MKQRIFIAFKVSEEAGEELKSIQTKLQDLNKKANITWSKPRGFHVTVLFLGEIEEFQVEEVKNILLDVANSHHGFYYWLDRLDGFPNKTEAKVLVARVEEEHRASIAIHDALAKEIEKAGIIPETKPWKPHITLGRNRDNHEIQGLNSTEVEKVIWPVDSIELIKSDREPGGSRYTVLESFELKK